MTRNQKKQLMNDLNVELSQLKTLEGTCSEFVRRVQRLLVKDKRPLTIQERIRGQKEVLRHLSQHWIGKEVLVQEKKDNWKFPNGKPVDGEGWCLDVFKNRQGKSRGCWREVEYSVIPETHKISIHFLGWDIKFDRVIDMDCQEDRRGFYPSNLLIKRMCIGRKKIKQWIDGETGSSYTCFKLDGFKLDGEEDVINTYRLTDDEVENVWG